MTQDGGFGIAYLQKQLGSEKWVYLVQVGGLDYSLKKLLTILAHRPYFEDPVPKTERRN